MDDIFNIPVGQLITINLLQNDDLGNPTATFAVSPAGLRIDNCTLWNEQGESRSALRLTCFDGGAVNGMYVLTNSAGSDTASVSLTAAQ